MARMTGEQYEAALKAQGWTRDDFGRLIAPVRS